ncbi:MAG: SH3 domain-containing protein [Bdellovibrionales bacterium]|nr:SH3 domain-containing protein [Bdellovibrionales bacterium]
MNILDLIKSTICFFVVFSVIFGINRYSRAERTDEALRAKLSEHEVHLMDLEETLELEEKKILEKLKNPGAMAPKTVVKESSYEVAPMVRLPFPGYTEIPAAYLSERGQHLVNEILESGGEIAELDRDLEALNIRSHIVDNQLDQVKDQLVDVRTRRLLALVRTQELQEIVRALPATDTTTKTVAEDASSPRDTTVEPVRVRAAHYTSHTPEQVAPRLMTREIHSAPPLKFGTTIITDDMPLAELVAEAVPFRTGPAPSFSPLFRGVKGDIVSIEKRYENWYRVVHQSGIRGWVSSEDVLFGQNSRSLPGKVVRIRGYDAASDRTDWDS